MHHLVDEEHRIVHDIQQEITDMNRCRSEEVEPAISTIPHLSARLSQMTVMNFKSVLKEVHDRVGDLVRHAEKIEGYLGHTPLSSTATLTKTSLEQIERMISEDIHHNVMNFSIEQKQHWIDEKREQLHHDIQAQERFFVQIKSALQGKQSALANELAMHKN